MSALASFCNKFVKAKRATIVVKGWDLPFRRTVECFKGVHFRHTVSVGSGPPKLLYVS
jgi:hypothetical protein